MLTWMRRQSGRTWVKGLMIVTAATFFGGFGLLSSTRVQSCMGVEDRSGNEPLALIDGKPAVIERDYQLRYHQKLRRLQGQLREQFPNQPVPDDMINYDKLEADTMDELVKDRLILLEAERLQLRVSDDELRKEIVEFYLSMTRDVAFNVERYRGLVRSIGFTEQMFEEYLREDLLKRKVLDLVFQGVGVLPEEVRERYAFDREKVKLEYVALDPAVVAAEAAPSEETVGAYFKKNEVAFYLGETRRVDYVAWPVAELLAGLSVGPGEVGDYYGLARDRYREEPERARALQILIKYDQMLESEDARALALARISEIRGEALSPGANFEDLARKYSESATRDAGGDLGWFIRRADRDFFPDYQAMDQAIEDAAFALDLDGVSEPVLTQFGYNLIKVVDRMDARYRPLEEVRAEVEEDILRVKAVVRAQELAREVREAVDAGKSLEEAAAEAGREVVRSEFFQEGDHDIFRLPDSRAIIEPAFHADRGRVAGPVTGEEHVYVFRVAEVKDAREGELDEVRDRIIARLKPAEELKAARNQAGQILADLRDGKTDLAQVADENQTQVQTLDLIERYAVHLPDLAYSDTLGTELAAMDPDNPWPRNPVAIGGKVVIMRLLETEPPDLSAFDGEKEIYERFIRARKQNEIYDKYIERLRGGRVTYTGRWKQDYAEN